MSLYAKYLLPRLTDLVMRRQANARERAALVPLASGIVLEIGVGSGLNLPFYGPQVRRLFALDPSRELRRLGLHRARSTRVPLVFLESSAEAIPLGRGTVDSVVTTWTLCTIPDPNAALREMRRVLKPEGRVLFAEHGAAPDAGVRRWQERLNPLWRRLAGGCNMNREIDDLFRAAGFRLDRLDTGYSEGPSVLSYFYKGIALPA